MKGIRIKLTLFCGAIFIATILPATALASRIDYTIENITDLSPSANKFTLNTKDNILSDVDLSFSEIKNHLLPALQFNSGVINSDGSLMFTSSTNQGILKLILSERLNANYDTTYQYAVISAYITETVPDGKSQQTKTTTSVNLAQNTSYIVDPVSSIPEPTSIALLASGLFGFAASRRKKNQA